MKNSPYNNLTVLILDDSLSIRSCIEQLLVSCGVNKILLASTITQAKEVIKNQGNDLDGAILDLVLEDGSGLEVAKLCQFHKIPVVFCTSTCDEHNESLMHNYG